jgi:hypothetical protein
MLAAGRLCAARRLHAVSLSRGAARRGAHASAPARAAAAAAAAGAPWREGAPPPRAAALIIGNEVLSGKIQDTNSVWLGAWPRVAARGATPRARNTATPQPCSDMRHTTNTQRACSTRAAWTWCASRLYRTTGRTSRAPWRRCRSASAPTALCSRLVASGCARTHASLRLRKRSACERR